MNVRKYGSPAAYVPNNKADKRWQKKSAADRRALERKKRKPTPGKEVTDGTE